MRKTFFNVLPLIAAVAFILFLFGCGQQAEPVVEKEEPTTKYLQVKAGDEVIAPFFDEHEFSGKWAPAKIVTPASDETKGKYEVEFLMGTPDLEKGEKRFVKDIIVKTLPAKKQDLKVGMIVFVTGGNEEDPTAAEMSTWQKAVISDIKDDAIEVEFFHQYPEESAYKEERFMHNVFIIDEPKP
jgi:uncharacterized lipoprotein NlpE involved in copper resistance